MNAPATHSSAGPRVTSDRLGAGQVHNRWFPKIRSWFALGAPLELLSPLSVARIVILVALFTWPIGWSVGAVAGEVALVLVVVSVGLTMWGLRRRTLDVGHVSAVLCAHVAMVVAALATSSNEHRAIALSVLLASMAIFAALFTRPGRLFVSMLVVAAIVIAILASTHGRMGLSNGVISALFAVLLGATTALTVRTARTSGMIDPETGLPNAVGLADRLARRHETRRGDVDTVVATVLLRGVAEVRDALGHQAAGELVRRAVEDLGQVLPTGAVIGRRGDDDAVVLLSNRPELAMSTDRLGDDLVRRIATAIGTGRYLIDEIEVNLNAHVGLAIAGPEASGPHPSELLRHSALAARNARDAGVRSVLWDGRSTTLTLEDLELLTDLRTAADRGELWVAYQPQAEAASRRIVSVEALLRWTSDRHGFISPGRFIPLAERTGLVDRLTDWVLDEALDAQQRWRAEGIDLTVSVNVSPLSLRSVDFSRRVQRALSDRSLPPSVLMLEVTESMAFDIPEAVERLGPLRDLGVQVSIDDFGTGYTSLSVLPHLPLDELKVDQQFVRDSTTSPASEAIVRSVCELAHRLGLSAVAEGVEDEELTGAMTAFGFDLLQGYHIARPMPEAALVELIEQQRAAAV